MKSDVQLQRHVLDELDWETSVDAAQIGVTAKDGLITLVGHVPVYAEKHLAEQATKRVHGVRAVANEIEVRPTDAHIRDDEDLAAAALHALRWDAKVPDERLLVTVKDGWIKVEGSLDEQFQKSAIERVLSHLAGTHGITNATVVVRKEVFTEVRNNIEAAFRRSATLASRNVRVEVDEQHVTLTGDVHSHRDLEEAERIAWSARGVQHVRNCITVSPWGVGPAEEWGY